ncbi:MAG: FecR domain-containing protein [Peptococcaceae bacterium]|jgi:hypothetical protein|nr:FecR domain-containing protein [Peptococcaceae bacterium]
MMKQMKQLLLAGLLCVSLAFIAYSTAAGAETAAAVTLRLEKTEGTVTLQNKSGKNLSILDSMKLFNGYELATALKSYAYISLDAAKAAKLDAGSRAEVRESGKKLGIHVEKGSLFFNVTAPLAADESLNIRTSTMIIGIRGTAGWIRVLSAGSAEVYVLSGHVTVVCYDPLTGETKSQTVYAGECAVSSVREGSEGSERPEGPEARRLGEAVEIDKHMFAERDIPGYVAAEIEKDPALRDKIAGETGLSVPLIVGEVSNKLAAGNLAAEEAQALLNAALEALNNNKNVVLLFEGSADPAGESGEGGMRSGTPTEPGAAPTPADSAPTPTPAPAVPWIGGTYTLPEGSYTAAQVTNYFRQYDAVVIPSGADARILQGETLTVPKAAPGATGGALVNQGSIWGGGALRSVSGATFENVGVIGAGLDLVNDGGVMNLGGEVSANSLTNVDGTVRIETVNPNGSVSLSGPLTVNGGAVTLASRLASDTYSPDTYSYSGPAVVVNGGTFNLTGGSGGSINGFLVINGGTANLGQETAILPGSGYTGGMAVVNGGLLRLDGCEINGTGASPAVTIGAGGTFRMSSGGVFGLGAPAIDNTAGGTAVYTGGDIVSDAPPVINGPILDAPGGSPVHPGRVGQR